MKLHTDDAVREAVRPTFRTHVVRGAREFGYSILTCEGCGAVTVDYQMHQALAGWSVAIGTRRWRCPECAGACCAGAKELAA
jgi:hypothetical protein